MSCLRLARAVPRALAGQQDDGDDDEAGQDQPEPGAEAVGVQHGHDEKHEQRRAPDAGHVAVAARHRGAADHHDRDRHQQVFRPHVQRRAAREAGQQKAAERRQHRAQDIGDKARAIDRNAGHARGGQALADGGDPAAVDGAVQQHPGADDQHQRDQREVRDAEAVAGGEIGQHRRAA